MSLAPTLAPRAAAQVTIPLQIVNIGTVSDPEYKLGIYVGLGGGTPKLYEFDTGAAGFFAAYSPTYTPWWTSFNSTSDNLTISYASGIQYNSTIVGTSVSLYASDSVGAVPVASVTANVGQIESATGSVIPNWNQDLMDGNAPLYGHFYGDFGMALYRNEGDNPVPPPGPGNPSLYAILPQLGANTSALGNGFIIHMGDYSNPTPTLQIGLTPADRARFTNTIAMNAPSAPMDTGTFPNGGGPTYSQTLISGNLLLNQGEGNQTTYLDIGAVLDTGAPSTEIHEYGNVTGLPTITTLAFNGTDSQSGLTDDLMQYVAGPLRGLNNVGHTTATNPLIADGYINTGLNIFFANDVMFDLENNRVGFAPVPEPADAALLAGTVIFSGLAMRRLFRARAKTPAKPWSHG